MHSNNIIINTVSIHIPIYLPTNYQVCVYIHVCIHVICICIKLLNNESGFLSIKICNFICKEKWKYFSIFLIPNTWANINNMDISLHTLNSLCLENNKN